MSSVGPGLKSKSHTNISLKGGGGVGEILKRKQRSHLLPSINEDFQRTLLPLLTVCSFGRGLHEEHFCEIILKLDQ